MIHTVAVSLENKSQTSGITPATRCGDDKLLAVLYIVDSDHCDDDRNEDDDDGHDE